MKFDPWKYKIMQITTKRDPAKPKVIFCGKILEEVDNHSYLDIEIDSTLKWTKHITQTTAKANRTLGFIKRNLWFMSHEIKAAAYLTMVRPTLEYASCAWDTCTVGLSIP